MLFNTATAGGNMPNLNDYVPYISVFSLLFIVNASQSVANMAKRVMMVALHTKVIGKTYIDAEHKLTLEEQSYIKVNEDIVTKVESKHFGLFIWGAFISFISLVFVAFAIILDAHLHIVALVTMIYNVIVCVLINYRITQFRNIWVYILILGFGVAWILNEYSYYGENHTELSVGWNLLILFSWSATLLIPTYLFSKKVLHHCNNSKKETVSKYIQE